VKRLAARWGGRCGFIATIVLLALVSGAQSSAQAQPPDTRLDWWRAARFGLFIHWGLYAVPAGEWGGRSDYGEWIRNNARIPISTYDRFVGQFNPTKFDADLWVRTAKAAGMKYIVITTKHHDGFALWDSKVSDFDVMATPFRRDILKALAAACQRHGLRLCFYHSIMDWHHPDYLPRRPWEATDRTAAGADFERYVSYLKAQLKELLTDYGPIGILWFDGQWEATWTNERGRDLYSYVRALQPSIIVNNRVAAAEGDGSPGDYGTPEQEIPATGIPGLAWETCMTMNRNWGFNRADKDYKSTRELVRNLIDIASKGGNFLLNVGPTAEGEFPPDSVNRLSGIGAWIRTNGEAIYSTTASPFPSLAWGRATVGRSAVRGQSRLFLHVFDTPADRVLVVPGLLNDVRSAHVLGDARALRVTRRGQDLAITVPDSLPADTPAVVVALDLVGEPDVTIPPVIEADAPVFAGAADVRVTTPRKNVELRVTTDGSEPTAASSIVAGPVRLTATATVKARAFRGADPVSPTAEATFTRVALRPAVRVSALEPGLAVQAVEGEFAQLPAFTSLPTARSSSATVIDAAPRTRDTNFALRFTGYLQVPAPGVYRFALRSDDGSRMWVGDQLLIDNDGLHGAKELPGYAALEAGAHAVVVEMFQADGGFDLALSWTPPGGRRAALPAGVLWHGGSR
jgi:alpha-L-fucosidase